jgi:hypothetical protein
MSVPVVIFSPFLPQSLLPIRARSSSVSQEADLQRWCHLAALPLSSLGRFGKKMEKMEEERSWGANPAGPLCHPASEDFLHLWLPLV